MVHCVYTHNTGATPLSTALLKTILRHIGRQCRLRRTGVMWSRQRAPVTLNEPRYSVGLLIAAVFRLSQWRH